MIASYAGPGPRLLAGNAHTQHCGRLAAAAAASAAAASSWLAAKPAVRLGSSARCVASRRVAAPSGTDPHYGRYPAGAPAPAPTPTSSAVAGLP